MKNIRLRICVCAMLAALAAFSISSQAAMAGGGKEIPEPLKPWKAWALWGDGERECPTPYSDAGKHLCFWPSRMGLQAEPAGGKFDMAVTVFHETWMPLPGGADAWPMEVRGNGAPLAVIERNGAPAVHLSVGTVHVEGAYHWNAVPQRLAIPREIGILVLVVDGKPVDAPTWDAEGFLWLKRDNTTGEADKNFLSVKLNAALVDGIPLWLRTEIELTVAGKSREEDIGVVLPEGWKLAAVTSQIPVAVDDAGRMKAQVRAGKWILQLDAFRFDNPKEIRYAPGGKPAVAEELVAFRARPDFRTVEISGPPAIDVSQTAFPKEWHDLPVYRWDTATPIQIEERMRGMGQQKPEGLNITREFWLDEGGQGMTFRDRIAGRMQEIWRLDAAAGQNLGAVRSGGLGQLITRNPQGEASGVEIRRRDFDIEATGRMARSGALSATGWRSDADTVNATLNIPPGWRLFAVFGADWVRGDWLTRWTLLDLFVLLIFSLAVFRIWGLGAGLLALAAFGLSYHEAGAPRYLWIVLLAPVALQRVAPEGRWRRALGACKWMVVALLALVLIPFVAQQVQQALYPQLEVVQESRSTFFPIFSWTHIDTMAPDGQEPISTAPPEVLQDSSNDRLQKIQQKLERIIIPKLEFREATIREAVDFLKKKSEELDTDSPVGDKGVNIVLRLGDGVEAAPAPQGPAPAVVAIPGLEAIPASPGPGPISGAAPLSAINPADARITVSLTNIPLIEALRYVTQLASLKFRVEPYAVFVVPASVNTDVLVTKEWKVRPDLIPIMPGQQVSAKDWLISNGVQFNGAASAAYIPATSRLIVRNTEDQLDLIDTIVQANTAPAAAAAPGALAAAPAPGGAPVPVPVIPKGNLAYDAKARIQTGPGVPEWKWRVVSFGWNGPVSASQQVKPVFISLAMERVLTVLRVALLLILAGVLLGVRKFTFPTFRPRGKAAAVLVLIFACFIASASAQSPIPSQATLDKLRERLLEIPDVYPDAADIPTVSLTLNGGKLVIEAEIHTAIRTAVPLPGRLPAWSPVNVLADDKPDVALRREDGYLWLVLDAGVHHVRVEGSLASVSDWEWTFLLKPRHVKIEAPGWTFSGVKPNGVPEAQVFFALKQKTAAGAASYERQELQSVASIDRHLELGLVWQVSTTVTRLSPVGKAVSLRVPLLPGENVLSANAVVKDGFIEVRLGAQEPSFEWESSLAPVPSLKLATRAGDAWVERWRLVASPVWNVTISGLPPIFESRDGDLVPAWQPWPGESVDVSISRPQAIAGATVTVSKARHEISLGKRQRVSSLELSLRCSVGEDFLVGLPADAEITSLAHDSKPIPVRKDGSKLIVPVHPGEQTVSIGWKRNIALGFRAASDEVRLPVESANIETTITVPDDRWVLWVNGPRQGPAVRFWGILICSLLAAVVLGRVSRIGSMGSIGSIGPSSIGAVSWMLLLIGLTQVPLAAALVVVGWLFFLAWRGGDSFQRLGNFRYNLLQIALIFITPVALVILVAAVGEGLLGRPEMFIVGNDSTRTALRWFQARSENLLPSCGCLSVSIWWYRLLMLAWALWLAASLIHWLRTGWQSFSSGGVFHRKAKAAAQPVPPPLAAN